MAITTCHQLDWFLHEGGHQLGDILSTGNTSIMITGEMTTGQSCLAAQRGGRGGGGGGGGGGVLGWPSMLCCCWLLLGITSTAY